MSGIPAGAGSLLGKRLGKFEILALLALGGTAEIYLARIGGAAGFEKYVVVKCLHDHLADDQEFVKMFLDEARLAAHLDHSNIVQTFELGEHDNRYYMVMEFLAGLSLAVIAHELLTGKRLFKRPSPYETYQAVLDCNVQPPSRESIDPGSLDPALDDIIMKAVEKDKEKRYPTAEAFGDALQSYLHHRGKS